MFGSIIFLLLVSFLIIIEAQLFTIDQFNIFVSDTEFANPSISIVSTYNKQNVWSSVPQRSFLEIGNATVNRPPILNGNYQIQENIALISEQLVITSITQSSPLSMSIYGSLYDMNSNEVANYTLQFLVTESTSKKLRFDVSIEYPPNVTKYANPRTYLRYTSDDSEMFFGFGESFTHFNLKGKRVPIVVSEQGVGRGEQPITDYLNTEVSPGVGGDAFTTYAPKPIYLTNYNHCMIFDGSDVMYFNLTTSDEVVVEVWSNLFGGWMVSGDSMLDLVETITTVTGRQKALPLWSQKGAIVGLEGGTENVTAIVQSMMDNGVPIAGVWLQDWVGLRHNWDGDRLIWNWEVNYDYYPGWNDMVDIWAAKGTKVLTYMSPFFSDPSNYTTNVRHNFYQEGLANGYFIKHTDDSVYTMYSLSIEFAMLDLTNPFAVRWMKNLIINSTIMEAQSSGWMCDFGEYLPFDAKLYSGESAASYHNKYPQAWGQLAQEASDEAHQLRLPRSNTHMQQQTSLTVDGDLTEQTNDIVFFMRSAWTQSPLYVPVFWLGDQLISWDGNDGIKTVITGALSSGLTGHAITHSDIGGYSVETNINNDTMYYVRTPELLKRWSELAAFGFGLFRTHIGSSTTKLSFQVYDTVDSMQHFAEFASIYANLSDYRTELVLEATTRGYPLIRPMAMHYAYDANVWGLIEQYLVGTQLLMAPCMTQGGTNVSVYFPSNSGPWTHLWSGNVVTLKHGEPLTLIVPTPIGFPAVFYRSSVTISGSDGGDNEVNYGEQLRAYVIEQNYTYGYVWDYSGTDSESANSSRHWFDSVILKIIASICGGALFLWFIYYMYNIYGRPDGDDESEVDNEIKIKRTLPRSINSRSWSGGDSHKEETAAGSEDNKTVYSRLMTAETNI